MQNELTAPDLSPEWRRYFVPPPAGLVGAVALIGVYLGILTFAQSLSHALEQLLQNQVWVGLVAMNAPHAMAGDATPA